MTSGPSWKVWVVLIGVFVAGGVVGGFVSLRIKDSLVERSRHSGQFAPRLLQHLADRLELTEDQRTQVRELVLSTWEEQQVHREASREAMREMNDQITAILTPEQREIFTEFRERQRQRWRDGGDRRDGPPRGHDGEGPPRPERPPPPSGGDS